MIPEPRRLHLEQVPQRGDRWGLGHVGGTVTCHAVFDESPVALAGITLTDATTGDVVDLGQEPPRALLTLIRHRY
ncbi:MAG: hypothetical protein NVS3B12_11120 [Acidimicrobiales bacterium]